MWSETYCTNSGMSASDLNLPDQTRYLRSIAVGLCVAPFSDSGRPGGCGVVDGTVGGGCVCRQMLVVERARIISARPAREAHRWTNPEVNTNIVLLLGSQRDK